MAVDLHKNHFSVHASFNVTLHVWVLVPVTLRVHAHSLPCICLVSSLEGENHMEISENK
jgi:hypothetical protein